MPNNNLSSSSFSTTDSSQSTQSSSSSQSSLKAKSSDITNIKAIEEMERESFDIKEGDKRLSSIWYLLIFNFKYPVSPFFQILKNLLCILQQQKSFAFLLFNI